MQAPRGRLRNSKDKFANRVPWLQCFISDACDVNKAEIILNHTPCWGKPLLCCVLRFQVCSDYLLSWLIRHMARRDPGVRPKSDTSLEMHGLHLSVWFKFVSFFIYLLPDVNLETLTTRLPTMPWLDHLTLDARDQEKGLYEIGHLERVHQASMP